VRDDHACTAGYDSKLIKPSVQIDRLAHSGTVDGGASSCNMPTLVQDHQRAVALTQSFRRSRLAAHKKEKAPLPATRPHRGSGLENKHRSSVTSSRQAPYLNQLAAKGVNMTHSYGVGHPSQPNYLALFSGSTRRVRTNACPKHFRKADNLGHQLRKSGLSFTGYSESLPKTGFRGCASGRYVRKHNPWVNFGTLPASTNRPLTAFPHDYNKLPTVAFVSPNMCHGMHDCSVRTGTAG
jgi:hypothetical protein